MRPGPPEIVRFVSKIRVTESNCWEWNAGCFDSGYGQFYWRGKNVRAHRFAWRAFRRQTIKPGICVLHKCDNPPCVNPDHLWLGTNADNIRDRDRKGRTSRGVVTKTAGPGERNGNAKLTRADSLATRSRRNEGGASPALRRRMDCGRTNSERQGLET